MKQRKSGPYLVGVNDLVLEMARYYVSFVRKYVVVFKL